MNDVLGQAIYNYYSQAAKSKLWIHNRYGKKEKMPVEIYFRSEDVMPVLELKALQQCRGDVLDIGAGAGSHALLLQQRGLAVTALDTSPKASEVMKQRGVQQVITQDIFKFKGSRYDTLLLLMNGIGLTGSLKGLQQFLQHARTLLKPGGQLLFDSSDVAYLYKDGLPENGNYYGEILYQYEYKKQKTEPFTWLYIDQETLTEIATQQGFCTTLLYEDNCDQYLVRLTLM